MFCIKNVFLLLSFKRPLGSCSSLPLFHFIGPNNTEREQKVFPLKSAHSACRWREKENRNCGKNSCANDKKLAHSDRRRCVRTSFWLAWARETDKSSLWSKWRRACLVVRRIGSMRSWWKKGWLSCISYSYTALLSAALMNYDTPVVCDFLLWWP